MPGDFSPMERTLTVPKGMRTVNICRNCGHETPNQLDKCQVCHFPNQVRKGEEGSSFMAKTG